MNTPLKALSFVSAVGIPSVFFAKLAGLNLPASLNVDTMCAALVGTVALLTIVSDYTRNSGSLAFASVAPAPRATITSIDAERVHQRLAA